MIVEMRIYHCAPTRLPALLDRFANTALGFFDKYGIEQIGFWTTLIGPSSSVSRPSFGVVYATAPAGSPGSFQNRFCCPKMIPSSVPGDTVGER